MTDRHELLMSLLEDLGAEQDALFSVVSGLDEAELTSPTPAQGWDVRDQIAHLAYFDEAAALAAKDPEAFRRWVEELVATGGDPIAEGVTRGRSLGPRQVVEWWERGRRNARDALGQLEPGARVPWYGPAMSPASFVTARLMETWAHGVDIGDALGREPVVSDRLRHIARLGVTARPYAYVARAREVPAVGVRVDLVAPSGEHWGWGPEGGSDRVSGTALDFCLLVTQRRHRDDLGLEVSGPLAAEWVAIAQAFAGPATETPPGRALTD